MRRKDRWLIRPWPLRSSAFYSGKSLISLTPWSAYAMTEHESNPRGITCRNRHASKNTAPGDGASRNCRLDGLACSPPIRCRSYFSGANRASSSARLIRCWLSQGVVCARGPWSNESASLLGAPCRTCSCASARFALRACSSSCQSGPATADNDVPALTTTKAQTTACLMKAPMVFEPFHSRKRGEYSNDGQITCLSAYGRAL